MIGLGELHLAEGEAHAALYFMQKALETAQQTENHYRYLVMQAHEGVAKCYRAVGRTDLEFVHWVQHFNLAEALLSDQTQQRLAHCKRETLIQILQKAEVSAEPQIPANV